MNYNYFEFTLRGGHDIKPGILDAWLYIMPAEAQCQFEIRLFHSVNGQLLRLYFFRYGDFLLVHSSSISINTAPMILI
ncbi:hypothetical protein KHA94_17000, partial [Bacillus sp. FJAT-49705]